MNAVPKDQLDDSPRPARTAAAPRRLIALTREEGLVASLQEVAAMGVDVAVVHDELELTHELMEEPGSIALIDAAAITGAMEQLADTLGGQFPDARLLVAGNGLEQSRLATRIASQRVYRFLHKPASAQRLKLFFDAANRPSDAARLSSTQTLEVLKTPSEPLARTVGAPPQRTKLMALGVAAAVVLAALVTWALRPSSAPVAKVAAATASSALEQLIQRADQAFAQSKFIGQDGSSASELYQQALARAPEDERARSGYGRSVDYGLRSIEEALTAGQLDAAESRIAAARSVAPRNARLEFLASQLSHERDRATAEASRKPITDARQLQLKAQLDASTESLRHGALLDPVDDSALSHLRAAERIAPTDQQVLALRSTLASRLLAAADSSLAASQSVSARRQLDAAAILGAEASTLDRLRHQADQLASESAKPAAPPMVAAASPPAPVAVAPVAVEAAPSAPATAPTAATEPARKADPEVISAAALKRTHTVEPDYPSRALQMGISGWVELEFTLTRTGKVRDVSVRASEPKGTFDVAAQDALSNWRFEPILKDGKPIEQRAWLRVRFTARDR